MKKIVIAVSILATLVMGACRPETRNQILGIPDDAILLTTENFTDNDAKTSVSGTSVLWVNGDQIDLYVGTGSKQTRDVVVSEGNAYIASALTGDGVIRGYYPAGLATENQTTDNPRVTLPAEYSCSVSGGRQVIALPMVGTADAGATTIKFRHLTAAVNVMLKNSFGSDLYVDSVVVNADVYNLNYASAGKTVYLNYDNFNLTASSIAASNATKRVRVSFPTALEVPAGSEDWSIQVPIMPIGADNLTIKVYCHSGTTRYLYSHTNASPAIALNQMLTAKVDLNTAGHMEEIVNITDLNGISSSSYEVSNGETLTGIPSRNLTCNIPDGATVTLKNVDASASGHFLFIRAKGDASLILSEDNVLNGNNVIINVVSGKTLTISGSGSLTATSAAWGCPAIGSSSSLPGGNIIIESGTVIANSTSSSTAAGIGCGSSGNCGTITINGGTVTASGGTGAAGIGTTSSGTAHSCGAITINGGTVTATGGTSSAGIGTGNGSRGTCGDITITGGTISATGGSGAAGVGTSAYNSASNTCGAITITSGVISVTVTKGSNATASIGKGNAGSTCGTVTIEPGANVTQN